MGAGLSPAPFHNYEMKIGVAINSHKPRIEWLKQCLESTKGFDEVFLYVQGISTEDLKEILSWDIPNITIDPGAEEIGIVEGFNRAVGELKSDWVCSFCDDDYFIQNNLNTILEKIRGGAFGNADVIHFPVQVDGGGGWGERQVTYEGLKNGNMLPHGSFIRREIFGKVGGYKSEIATDWEFWLRVAKEGHRFEFFESPVYFFRVRDGSAYKKQMEKIGGLEKMGVEVRRMAGV